MTTINPTHVSIMFSLAAFSFILFSLSLFPYAPLQDLGEWIYQSYIFNQLVIGHYSSDFLIKTYPVPYTLFQIIASSVLLLFSPIITSKIVVLLYGFLVLLAIHRLITTAKLDPVVGWAFLIPVVALNSPFWNGYMGYQFGLIVLLFYVSLPRESRTQVLPVLFFSILAFFAHGIIYASILIFIGIYSLYSRRIFQCALALLPSLCLVAWYQIKNDSSGELKEMFQLHDVNIIAYKIYTLLKTGPFHNPIVSDFNSVDYFGSFYLTGGLVLDAAFMASLGILAYAAVTRSSLRTIAKKPEFVIFAILFLVAVALPPAALVTNPAERLMYPALIAFAMAVFGEQKLPTAPKVTLTAALIGGYGLMALALIPASAHYPVENNERRTSAPQQTQLAVSRRYLFGHRFMQFDSKMKMVEQAWRADTMPADPLAFDTALLLPKAK